MAWPKLSVESTIEKTWVRLSKGEGEAEGQGGREGLEVSEGEPTEAAWRAASDLRCHVDSQSCEDRITG